MWKDIQNGIKEVERFFEKPNVDLAQKYLDEGTYLWNGGMFVWKIKHILNQIKEYLPLTYEVLHSLENVNEEEIQNYIDINYKKTVNIYRLCCFRKSKNIFVIPSEIGWDDCWYLNILERYREKDIDNNVIIGDVKQFNSMNNIIISSCKPIILDGVKSLYIIETDDRIIIGDREKIDKINEIKSKI